MRCPEKRCGRRYATRSLVARHLAYDHRYTTAQAAWATNPWRPCDEFPSPVMPVTYVGVDR